MSVKRFIRNAARTAMVAAIGCIVIVIAVPFVKILAVRLSLRQSAEHLAANSADAAAECLLMREKWAQRFTVVEPDFSTALIRAYMRQGDLAAAEDRADAMYGGTPVPLNPPPLPVSVVQARGFLSAGPDWLANRILTAVRKGSVNTNRDCGYTAMLLELKDEEKYAALKTCAERILRKDPGNPNALAALAFVTSPSAAKDQAKSATIDGTAVAVKPPSASRSTPDVSSINTQARESELLASIAERKKQLLAAASGDLASAYAKAVANYKNAEKKARALESEWQGATGGRRAQLSDQLRVMKGELARLEAAWRSAKKVNDDQKVRLESSLAADPVLRNLKRQLSEVQNGTATQ